ncbi:MAG: DNA recombination protein RmuC [Patescibacteria group bacterium]|nr:DNA recombination protein RmuC [Patescibacteria group bacterium]
MSELVVFAGVVLVGFVAVALWLEKRLRQDDQPDIEQLVNRIYGETAEKTALQSKHILEGERDVIKTDLENKHQQISRIVKQLEDDLKQRQLEIQRLEKERGQQFGSLSKQLEQQREMSQELKASTEQLNRVLSNNQKRGEWGERIIEDLLQSNGLVEGVHYSKQTKLTGTELRPDVILLLPNHRVVPVDVKFPLSELQKMAETNSKTAKEIHSKQFVKDVRIKIDKVAEYLGPGMGTLDYAVLFVPNEAVFSYLNQTHPEVIDYAIAKRILMVSPFTFLIVARTIMESYRNFMIGDKLKDVVHHIDDFVGEWSKFKESFSKYGRTLQTLQTDYEQISGTRVRQMERRIDKVKKVGSGGLLEDTKVELLEE